MPLERGLETDTGLGLRGLSGVIERFLFCLNLYIVFCTHFTFKGKKLNIKIWSHYAIERTIERDVFYGCVALTGTC